MRGWSQTHCPLCSVELETRLERERISVIMAMVSSLEVSRSLQTRLHSHIRWERYNHEPKSIPSNAVVGGRTEKGEWGDGGSPSYKSRARGI